MKIPNKIILLGEEYEIRIVSKKDLECDKCGEEALAMICHDEKVIYISKDDKENTILDLLLHELGHYYSEYYGLGKNEAWAEAFAGFTKLIIKQLNLK